MLNLIVNFAVERRWIVLVLAFLIACLGLYSAFKLPIDAVPDITNVQVQINSEAIGFSPLEVEQRITYPIENAMAGLPSLDYSRSLSRYGLSQVTIVFDEGTDIYWARQLIAERLQSIRSELPATVEPTLGPIASGLGEVFTYLVRAKDGALKEDGTEYNPEDLRTIQDWIIRPQLVKVPGITEINSIGGYERQYQVSPVTGKLLAFKVDIADIVTALKKNNLNAGLGYIERRGEQWLIRSPGQLSNLMDIENVIIAKRDDAPVRVGDVATVSYGKELRTGAATLNGKETVLGTAFMLLGENSRVVANDVAAELEIVNRSLPTGVEAVPAYNRTTLVDKTIATVQKNLFEGAALVIVVLFALLGNFRAALITAFIIPLSMLFAITGLSVNRMSGNLMSLGAIDFGLIVDGAVIVVENALSRLSGKQRELNRVLNLDERLMVVAESTKEVFSPAVFGVLIIMLVYLPLFALSGVEGKMFHPMAFTVVAALLGALIFSVTFVPAAVAIFVTGKVSESENILMKSAKKLYQPTLRMALARPIFAIVGAAVLVTFSLFQASRMGTEFLPQLDEHDIALHALRIPGTGLTQSVDMQMLLESEISSLPEVSLVFSKIGTPEIATDPMPPNVADTFVMLKPRNLWPDPSKAKLQFIDELRQVVEALPGNKYEFTQPIEMRFNELIAGVRTDVAVRVYGDNLEQLAKIGDQIEKLLTEVPGAKDVRVEQVKGLPMISVEPQRDHLALLGLSVEDLQAAAQVAIGGIQSGLIYEGDRRFGIYVRMDDSMRTVESLSTLPLFIPHSGDSELDFVPLREVADIKLIEGPNQINRRDGKRNVVVTANVSGRDLGGFISETQEKMNRDLMLPSGYWLEYGGTFEQLQSASQRLSIVVPLTLLLILGLLYLAFGSLKDSLIVFSGVPLALTGGVLALFLRDMPISISALVGFIALSGVAVLNGVVMISFIRQLRHQGAELLEAIVRGATSRLRPVLMTALVASLGFVPMAFNLGAGAEVQRPLATVVIGGIVSSTLLTLVVLPALYRLVHGLKSRNAST
tara:strand:+ start:16502 stop:19636 length:3135 start_codon:yes stop_codon:yes gene_type:complete